MTIVCIKVNQVTFVCVMVGRCESTPGGTRDGEGETRPDPGEAVRAYFSRQRILATHFFRVAGIWIVSTQISGGDLDENGDLRSDILRHV